MLWHILTSEFPPDAGGVADFSAGVVCGLASRGHEVHVWYAPRSDSGVESLGEMAGRSTWRAEVESGARAATGDAIGGGNGRNRVRHDPQLHRLSPGFGVEFRQQLTASLARFTSPQRLFIQYTPHGFGWKAMNVPLCWWLLERKRTFGDDIWVMFHEVAFPIVFSPIRRLPLGLVNRAMAALVLRASSRVFMSIPGWEPLLRGLAPAGKIFEWLPVPSNLPPQVDQQRVTKIRETISSGRSDRKWIVGHFGTFGESVTQLLTPALAELVVQDPKIQIVLVGRSSEAYAEALRDQFPNRSGCVWATGFISAESAAEHIAACDVMFQPFADGISSRRTSIMASMALGVPAVSTIGYLTEPCWGENELLPLSPVGDSRALVENAIALLRDEPRRCALAGRLRKFYEERFSLRSLLDRLEL